MPITIVNIHSVVTQEIVKQMYLAVHHSAPIKRQQQTSVVVSWLVCASTTRRAYLPLRTCHVLPHPDGSYLPNLLTRHFQNTDTGPATPNTDLTMSGVRQGGHYSTNVYHFPDEVNVFVSFHVPRSLVCHLLPVAQSIETSDKACLPLVPVSKGRISLFV